MSADKSKKRKSLLRDEENLRALYKINQLISSIFNIDELLDRIINVAVEVLEAERGFIVLKDDQTSELIPKAVHNRDAAKITISKTIVDRVYQTGEPIITSDAMSDDRFIGGSSIDEYQIHSCMCAPLKSKNKILGIIHVDRQAKSFSEKDLELLAVIATEAGVVVENAQLYEANIRAERLAATGNAIAGFSHYIKNIVTAVDGGESLVEDGLAKKNEDMFKKGWNVVRQGNEKISQLVLNMLDFSKAKEPLKKKSDINNIVNDVVSLIKDQCELKSVKIKTDLEEDIPLIDVDPVGIHRAVLNIVSNALEAVEKGSGEIVLKTEAPSPQKVQISIADNGCGIAPEDIPLIFEFFSSTKGSKGTGLGLAVSKKIVEEHEGEIKVESVIGQGTTFTIIL